VIVGIASWWAAEPQAADAIVVSPIGDTTVPGVLVAGDAAVGMPSVANAIAEGSNAAAAVVRSLLVEDHGLPLAGCPHQARGDAHSSRTGGPVRNVGIHQSIRTPTRRTLMSERSRRRLRGIRHALLAALVGVAISLTVGGADAAAPKPHPAPPGGAGPAGAGG
jgi:hypothetical protein